MNRSIYESKLVKLFYLLKKRRICKEHKVGANGDLL